MVNRAQSAAALQDEVRRWIMPVLQPTTACYEGYGVARPSAFVPFGEGFLKRAEVVFKDRGGPGSWFALIVDIYIQTNII